MNFRSSAVAACLLATVTAGCGTVAASSSGDGATSTTSAVQATASAVQATASAATTRQSQPPSTVNASTNTSARSGCQSLANGTALTLASNGRTYCIRLGEHFSVFLRGTLASRWLEPLASSNVIVGAPNGAMSLVASLTGASFAGARLGRALITSVRPPCSGPIMQKNELEPNRPVPRTYRLLACAPQRRFSVSIIVLG